MSVCLSKALWNQSSDNECVLVTHSGVPLDRFKRIERLQPLRGDWSLASARFTVPIVRPVKRKRVLSSLHVRIRYPDRRLAHVCWKQHEVTLILRPPTHGLGSQGCARVSTPPGRMAGRYQKCHLLELLQGLVHDSAGPIFANRPQLLVPACNQMCMGDTLVVCCLNCLQSKTPSR